MLYKLTPAHSRLDVQSLLLYLPDLRWPFCISTSKAANWCEMTYAAYSCNIAFWPTENLNLYVDDFLFFGKINIWRQKLLKLRNWITGTCCFILDDGRMMLDKLLKYFSMPLFEDLRFLLGLSEHFLKYLSLDKQH